MDRRELEAILADRLAAAQSKPTGSASRAVRAAILARDPGFDKGEITEKGSLNQRALRAGHTEAIRALYAGAPGLDQAR